MKVSFCITCKGRAYHLKETVTENILDNSFGGQVEFVILNYNSEDDLRDWVKSNLKDEMSSGIVTYWEERTRKFYDASHSKNVAHMVATGEVICNLDADCFTGKNAAKILSDQFMKEPGSFVRQKDNCGWLAMPKVTYYRMRGYGEDLVGWGYDDLDLGERCKAAGVKEVHLVPEGSHRINHSDDERVEFFAERKHPYAMCAENIARVNARKGPVNPDGYGRAVLYKNGGTRVEVGVGPCGT